MTSENGGDAEELKKQIDRSIIHADFQGHDITFTNDGWFSATDAAAAFGKRVQDWVENKETVLYLEALARALNVPDWRDLIRAQRGRGGGTWMHPKLATPFGRWLNVDFAVWCDLKVESLIRGKGDWHRARHGAASSNKVMADVLKFSRDVEGKSTKPYHYANECRLVNRVITGEWGGIDRDLLGRDELDLLAKLENRNTVMIARGVSRDDRIEALNAEAAAFKRLRSLPQAA